MAEVFISYARADEKRAAKLAAALESTSLSVWWDPDIPPGQGFPETIERELRQAKVVVVLWSRQSIKSDWVKNEARLARKLGTLIPARLDDAELPFEFSNIHTADLIGWKGQLEHTGFHNLRETVAGKVARRRKLAHNRSRL